MTLRYLSVFSGIGAADLAFTRLGWTPVAFAEIDPFCAAVLKERFPDVPNLGDATAITAETVERLGGIELLVGGPPCQDYSVAGERAGMDGDDGRLLFEFARLAGRLRPRWLVMENVPGLLSAGGGRDFGAFLGALGHSGFRYAFRVLDGRHFGVPQRRRRVFVVAHLGAWGASAAVLLEPESLRRDPAPRREAGPDLAGTLGGGAGSRSWAPDVERMTFVPQVLPFDTTQVTSHLNYSEPKVGDPCHPLAAGAHPPAVAFAWQQGDDSPHTGTGRGRSWVARAGDYTGALSTTRHDAVAYAPEVAPALRSEGADARRAEGSTPSEDGEGRQALVAYSIHPDATHRSGDGAYRQPGLGVRQDGTSYTMDADRPPVVAYGIRTQQTQANGPNVWGEGTGALQPGEAPPAVAIGLDHTQDPVSLPEGMPALNQDGQAVFTDAVSRPITSHHKHDDLETETFVATLDDGAVRSLASHEQRLDPSVETLAVRGATVRRLTPRECERLQALPDDWTLITYKGKPAADSQRYRAIGNALIVNVAHWIGERLQRVDALVRPEGPHQQHRKPEEG